MRGNILRVDPGTERFELEWALMSRQRDIEKRLHDAHGDEHAKLLGMRDAVKRLLKRMRDDG